jgi:hypothetical protein
MSYKERLRTQGTDSSCTVLVPRVLHQRLMLTLAKSFALYSSPEEKRQFLDLIRGNEDLGNDYIENDFMLLTTEEIRNVRPLQTILPEDVLIRAVLIATSICVGAEDDRGAS